MEGLETVDVNPNCVTTLDLQVERIGGAQGTLIAFVIFCLITMLIWIMIVIRSSCIKNYFKDEYDTVFNNVIFNDDDDSQDAILGETSINMRDSDIWSHYYRMYLIGENSISYPWYMPKDFPSDALNEVPKDRFLYFIKKE